jgi:uroporphyrinogen-III synthase
MGTKGQADQPLRGRHIAITRPPQQAPELAARLEAEGARVTTLAAVKIAPIEDTGPLDAALRELATFDWLVLTSVNGVQAVSERLAALGLDWDARGRARIAVIGPATATALREHGVAPDYMPFEYVAERILDGLGNVAGQRILLARADIARRELADALRLRGAEEVEVAAYRAVVQRPDAAALRETLVDDRPDAVTFTSSSTVRGFMRGITDLEWDAREALRGIALACIGPITAATLREYALEPDIVAAHYTMPGLVQALIDHFKSVPSVS